ncbi:MAG: vitamin K epoxide reductase family protein [Planctomycetota bacterium]
MIQPRGTSRGTHDDAERNGASPPSPPESTRKTPPAGNAGRWAVAALAGAALALALFLTWQTAGQQALPPGCGEGSGCGEVLSSAYGKLLGLPVSAFAAAAYATLLVAWFSTARGAAWIIAATSAAILAAAGWFVWLQLFELNAVCVYCMIDHGVGAAASLGALASLAKRGLTLPQSGLAAGAGVAAAAAMAGVQLLTPAPIAQEGVAVDGDQAHHVTIGADDATHRLQLLFDYACPHCREAHEMMFAAVEARPDLAVALVPIAIHPACNDAFDSVSDRFHESCELATLALAVQAVNPDAFVAFDRWLYDWDAFQPRPLDEARAKAEALVDTARLDEAIASGAAAQHLRANIDLFKQSQASRVPVLLIAGRQPIVGRIGSFDQVADLLDGAE